jgi:hypothetical protein
MNQLLLSVAVILLAVLIGTVPAGAKKTRGGTGRLNAASLECWKQHGAAYDPVKKKWILFTSEEYAASIGDAIRQCISRRMGILPRAIPIPEEEID